MTQLLPAYMMSELRTAFEIGFMIYLPFLVIDLVIASMLILVDALHAHYLALSANGDREPL